MVSEFVVIIANQNSIGKQEHPPAFPTPSGGMIRFRFEGFFPRVGKSQPPVRKAPLSSAQTQSLHPACQEPEPPEALDCGDSAQLWVLGLLILLK
jgi:hypothetical protein